MQQGQETHLPEELSNLDKLRTTNLEQEVWLLTKAVPNRLMLRAQAILNNLAANDKSLRDSMPTLLQTFLAAQALV